MRISDLSSDVCSSDLLGAYALFGAAKALSFGVPPLPAAVMGVFTACVGGIIRDTLAGEPSILMRPELYVTAAALAAALYVGLRLQNGNASCGERVCHYV